MKKWIKIVYMCLVLKFLKSILSLFINIFNFLFKDMFWRIVLKNFFVINVIVKLLKYEYKIGKLK